MANELIISGNSSGVAIALLTDRKLVEYQNESSGQQVAVGDFYLGIVKKISASLNAAFVDIGLEKDAFLPYFDLGPNIRSVQKLYKLVSESGLKAGDLDNFRLEEQTVKTGKISTVLKKGDRILVQVIKEPIGNKGPKVGCDISIAGRYFVLVPFGNSISISKKIGDPEEKKRLKSLAGTIRFKNFGVIVRTVADGTDIEELDKDLRMLHHKWDLLIKNLKSAQPKQLVMGEGNRVETLLRDLLNDDFNLVAVNDEALFRQVHTYVGNIAPGKEKIVKHYQGKPDIFEQYGVARQIKSSFGRTVPFGSGGYLIVEHTEALHVFDINSGSINLGGESRDAIAAKINLEAVEEIARQIRLRDMGGIIVIDFIDLRDPEHKKTVFQGLVSAMKQDRANHTILPMSKFGLVQITRQRVRPETVIVNTETCPDRKSVV